MSKRGIVFSGHKRKTMDHRLNCLLLLLFVSVGVLAQEDKDAFFIKNIYEQALEEQYGYQWLGKMTGEVGHRFSGSANADKAVVFVAEHLQQQGFDSVWLQEVEVPRWERGEKEVVSIQNSSKLEDVKLNALSLGNSVGTPEGGVRARVIEVHHLEDLDSLGRSGVEGKIVFFNRPFNNKHIRTFNAYGGAVDQRVYGPSKAAEYGALAAVVRSMTGRLDDVPHTGVTVYRNDTVRVPGIAISTLDANYLSEALKKDPELELFIEMDCKNLDPVISHNVIGDWYGSERDSTIILLGAHLDSWDVGTGAHDDGAGCAHIMDAFHILRELDYQPKHRLRLVFFMNEENGLKGGLKYAEWSNENDIDHLVAIESDAGGFVPRGFSCDGNEEILKTGYKQLNEWADLMSVYGITFTYGGSGADIGPLKPQGPFLIGLRPDSQRYFDYHHTAIDTFDAVHPRELQLGSAAMAALTYLFDQYGIAR